MLKIQEYLRSGGTVEQIKEELHLHVREHTQYPNLLLFKYNQIHSPLSHPICQESRGLILDSEDNWKVVAYPFRKFFNYSEGLADKFDFTSAEVYEKIDGTLCTLYYYAGAWHVSTLGVPDASGPVHEDIPEETFKSLFWKVWMEKGYDFPRDIEGCYMFELTTHYNRIICKYEEPGLTLLGARHIPTLEELEPEIVARENGWTCVKKQSLSSLENAIEFLKQTNPLETEGFVIKSKFKENGNFLRYKIKSLKYLALAHLKEGMCEKRMLSLIQLGETSEVLAYFPEFKPLFENIFRKFNTLLFDIELMYSDIENIPEQKDFAKEALKYPYFSILFQMRKDKTHICQELLESVSTDKLLSWIEDL